MRRTTAAVCLLALTACSASKPIVPDRVAVPTSTSTFEATTSTTMSGAALGQQYLRIVAPDNAALAAFNAKVTDKTTGPQLAALAQPLNAAARQMSTELVQASWPAQVAQDIRAVVLADASLSADLDSAGTVTLLTEAGWAQQFQSDAGKVAGAVTIVRAELHLPPSGP